MRKLIIPLLLLSQLTFAQTDKVQLFNFESSTCDGNDSGRLRTRIIKKEFDSGILTVYIAATATCCVNFEPRISVKNGVLYLDVEETGTECECTCCYEFTYRMKGIEDGEIQIRFRDKDIELSPEKFNTYPVVFEILNGDTVGYVDKYGFRQGKRYFSESTLGENGYYEFENGVVLKRVTFYPDKRMKSLTLREKIVLRENGREFNSYSNYIRYVEYFESGMKKKECLSDNLEESYRDGRCKEWNEKGELIFEGDFRR